jgi:hypothetical protein
MGGISDAIGTFLEDKLRDNIPGIVDRQHAKNHPDFWWDRVWIEAKAAFNASDYGAILKLYQVRNHDLYPGLIYAFGYHDFERASKRLRQKTMRGKVQHLHHNASIAKLYLVSAEIAAGIWVNHHLLSKKKGVAYCKVPPHYLERIIDDKPVRRKGRIVIPSEYYNLPPFVARVATVEEPLGYVLTEPDYAILQERIPTINRNIFADPPK